MRRFLLKQDEATVEGVMFSDGFIVIHGMFFVGMNIVSMYELGNMFPKAKVEWIDKEEKVESANPISNRVEQPLSSQSFKRNNMVSGE